MKGKLQSAFVITTKCTRVKVAFVHTMKAYGGGLQIHAVLSLTVNGGEWWSASCPSYITPGGSVLYHPFSRRLDGPQNWSGCCGEETPVGNQPFIGCEASSLVGVWTELS
jgi:hypothetical protein